jgi:hypothetical protein
LANLDSKDPVLDGSTENFVTFHIGELGFIMERRHFYAAIYRHQSTGLSLSGNVHTTPYIHELLNFDDRNVVMFNLDELLMDLFHLTDPGSIRVAIIAGLGVFGEECRDVVAGLLDASYAGCAGDALAFRISSDGAIRGMAFSELRLLPAGLRDCLAAKGILACRFVGESIEYLIDPAVLALPSLSGPAMEVE